MIRTVVSYEDLVGAMVEDEEAEASGATAETGGSMTVGPDPLNRSDWAPMVGRGRGSVTFDELAWRKARECRDGPPPPNEPGARRYASASDIQEEVHGPEFDGPDGGLFPGRERSDAIVFGSETEREVAAPPWEFFDDLGQTHSPDYGSEWRIGGRAPFEPLEAGSSDGPESEEPLDWRVELDPPDEVLFYQDGREVFAQILVPGGGGTSGIHPTGDEGFDATDIINPATDAPIGHHDFSGTYMTYLYSVVFGSEVEVSLPKPLGGVTAGDDDVLLDTVHMRIHIPLFLASTDLERLGVVLCMEGGISWAGSVREDPTKEDQPSMLLRAYLASGLSYPDPEEMVDRAPEPYHFRPGDPMVVAVYNYPGRGTDEGLRSEGAADFVGEAPDNPTGQDMNGLMTLNATRAVAGVLLAIVEDLQAQWEVLRAAGELPGALGSEGHRLVVCTRSWGLNTGSRWAAVAPDDGIEVHALVDWEGPTNSEEAMLVTKAYDPYGIADPGTLALPTEHGLDATVLSVELFEVWAAQDEKDFPFWFRPPNPTQLDGPLPESWDDFVTLIDGSPTAWAWPAWAVAVAWDRRYHGRYDASDDVWDQLEEFWTEREAATWLGTVTRNGTAYIRVQGADDHNQPIHLRQRHAIRALNAAAGGDRRLVYYADRENYWYDITELLSDSADPILMPDEDFDLANTDDTTETGAWFDREFWPDMTAGEAWSTQLDLIRWAMAQEFGESSYTSPTDDTWDDGFPGDDTPTW